ncbi:MAG TPA: hypothetical protein VKK61_11660, partial [Tepidisphaeraceae bacterium]|nr:hypothetical protein [Tepidisphaeraceae bacterium]
MSSHLSSMRILLIVTLFFAFCSRTIAQTNSQLTLAPWSDGAFGETNDRPLYQSQAHLKNEAANAQVFWWDSYGRFRLDKNDPSAPAIGYRWATMNFDTNSAVVPQHLDDISMALGLHLTKDLAVVAGAGYTSDSPFSDANGVYGLAHITYQYQLDEKNSLQFSVDYNGNGGLFPDVPLPGVEYIHREHPFSWGIGFPDDFVTWEITPELRFDMTYSAPFTANAD